MQHIVVSNNPWDWRFGTEVAATLSLLAIVNFTLGAVLSLVGRNPRGRYRDLAGHSTVAPHAYHGECRLYRDRLC
ncbi:MAG TPA: hypothetical protein VN837_14000 [Chloroflexota bacterium]|nr:hypothetical protein [Chloroflexota bacterium]